MYDLVTDNSFQIEKSFNYILSIQVSLGGFSFSIVNPDEQRLLVLKNKQLTISDDRFISRHFEEWFQSEEIFQHPFKQIRLIVLSEKFSIVPKEFYIKEKKREIINYLLDLGQHEVIARNSVEDFNSQLLFTLPPNLANVVNQPSFLHPVKILIEKRPEVSAGTGLILWFSSSGIYLILYNKNQLLLANHFKITHDNDVIYYILTALKQLNISLSETELYLGGELEHEGSLKKLLYNYFESVRFLTKDDNLIIDSEIFSQSMHPFILLFP